MPNLTVSFVQPGFAADLDGDPRVIDLSGSDSAPIQAKVVEGGMTSGLPSVILRLDLPDGKIVLAETSGRLFCTAAKAIMARYPGLFDGP